MFRGDIVWHEPGCYLNCNHEEYLHDCRLHDKQRHVMMPYDK